MTRTTMLFPALLASMGLAAPPALASGEEALVAHAEYEEVMALRPNLENGRNVYMICTVCHLPEGWGSPDGTYPRIAGQHRTVIIKQLADIRARNRDNPLMYPFSVPRVLGGAQNIADVAAYVAQLPMTAMNGKGPGADLERGARIYADHCANCHGERGEGNPDEHIPMLAGQHYPYMMRQFDAIRDGRRKNSDPQMVKQIDGFTPAYQAAVIDYVSRLPLPASRVAPLGWTNPDFPSYVRTPMGAMPPVPPMPPGFVPPPPPSQP